FTEVGLPTACGGAVERPRPGRLDGDSPGHGVQGRPVRGGRDRPAQAGPDRAASLQAHARLARADLDLRQVQLHQEGAEAPRQLGGILRAGAAPRMTSRGHPAVATRPRYSPVRVSTFTTSPSLRNSGTCTTAPVSRVAGLFPP